MFKKHLNYKEIYQHAFDHGDIEKFKQGLDGIIIVNDNSHNHTLNTAIRRMLSQKYFPEFIEELFDHGATVCNYKKNNTLRITIKHARHHIMINKLKPDHNMIKTQMIDLIQFLIKRGAEATKSDMFSVAIYESKDPLIILLIIQNDIKQKLSCFINAVTNNENYLLNTVKLLISRGFNPNDKYDVNLLSLAIAQQKKISVIEFLGTVGVKPINPDDRQLFNNVNYTDLNNFNNKVTLTHAVETNNIDMVKIAIKLGALPDNSFYDIKLNTLSCSFKYDSEITFEIIKQGGNCIESRSYISDKGFLTIGFDFYLQDQFYEIDYLYVDHQMYDSLDLMMCGGIMISNIWYQENKYKKILNHLESKMLIYYKLLNSSKFEMTSSDYEKLNDLIVLMDKLIEEDPVDKKNKFDTLDISLYKMPCNLIDIIYHYQHSNYLADYIYWNDFKTST